jgi:hypothetical protein
LVIQYHIKVSQDMTAMAFVGRNPNKTRWVRVICIAHPMPKHLCTLHLWHFGYLLSLCSGFPGSMRDDLIINMSNSKSLWSCCCPSCYNGRDSIRFYKPFCYLFVKVECDMFLFYNWLFFHIFWHNKEALRLNILSHASRPDPSIWASILFLWTLQFDLSESIATMWSNGNKLSCYCPVY